MAALDYLKANQLIARTKANGRLAVWPKAKITPEVRAWIKAHRIELLLELNATGDSPGSNALLDTLLNQRNLGQKLEEQLRDTLQSMNHATRKELVIVVDDAFEIAISVASARQHCHRLLSNFELLAAAEAIWSIPSDQRHQQGSC